MLFRSYRSVFTTFGDVNGPYTSGPTIGRSVGGTQVDIEAYTMDNNFIADFDTGPIAHTALLGVDHRTFSTRSVTGPFPATTGLNALAPDHDLPIRFPAFTSTSRIDAQQTGVYFQDQAKFDRFILTLGGRYDTARQTGPTRTFAPNGLTIQDVPAEEIGRAHV